MKAQISILVVDDDKFLRKIMNKALSPHYSVHLCESGEEALRQLDDIQPELIVLDVEMPGLNGYDVCLRIKESPQYQNIPIIFLSGRGSIQERMCGFDCGADDYLVKPFETEVLLAKIRVLLRYSQQQDSLTKEIDSAKKTAISALTGSSELGQAMLMVQRSHACTSLEMIADCTLNYMTQLELNACLLIKNPGQQFVSFSNQGQCSPMEQELMILLRDKGRIFDFSARSQFNCSRISLLIKNMPLIDPERYGRYKDLFPAILGALDARLTVLESEQTLIKQNQALAKAFDKIQLSLKAIVSQLNQSHKQSVSIMSTMLQSLETELLSLGLDEDQEQHLVRFVDKYIQQSLEVSDNSSKIESSIQIVHSALHRLLEQQNALMLESLRKPEIEQEETDDESVTLF